MNQAASSLKASMLGQKLNRKLIYHERYIQLDPGVSGVVSVQKFSANGCYDPDVTGTGHQPMGFDQIMQLYYHYGVVGSKITASFSNTSATQAQLVGISIVGDSAVSATASELIEQGNTTWLLLGALGSGTDTAKLSLAVNPGKFLGDQNVLDEESMQGSISANPAEQVYFYVWAEPLAATDTVLVRMCATIEYQVAFLEPKNPGSS
jgi:hypothetical protein